MPLSDSVLRQLYFVRRRLVGTWSGVSGAAGDFRITLKLTAGKLTPDVMFTMGSTEVKTPSHHQTGLRRIKASGK